MARQATGKQQLRAVNRQFMTLRNAAIRGGMRAPAARMPTQVLTKAAQVVQQGKTKNKLQ